MRTYRGTMAVGCVLALVSGVGACSGEDPGDVGAASSRSTSASPRPTPTPTRTPEMTGAEYERRLRSAVEPLGPALARLFRARTAAGVSKGVELFESYAHRAGQRLGRIADPPSRVALEHSRLSETLNSLNLEPTDECSARAALLSLGTGLDELRRALDDLRGKGISHGVRIPSPPKRTNRRLGNGEFVERGSRTGGGRLTIENGADSDAVVALARGRDRVFAVYVRKSGSYTVRGIRYGTYVAYVANGTDYDRGAESFTRECSYEKFDRTLDYPRGYRSTWTLTLYPVVGGNATTTDIGADEFPR